MDKWITSKQGIIQERDECTCQESHGQSKKGTIIGDEASLYEGEGQERKLKSGELSSQRST